MPESGQDPHGRIVGEGEFKYRIDAKWGQLDPEQYPVDNCHDLAIDSKGRVFMVTDNTRNNIIVYDQAGNLIEAWGTEYPGAHAIEIVNENGEDFIYLVDSGWIANRNWDGKSTDAWDSPFNKVVAQSGFVVKLTIEGRLIYTIGHPQTVGAYQPDMPFRPTDIAVADNGDLYITDGYGSDYVLQYDLQGRYIRHWGGHDNIAPEHNLVNTHGIAIETRKQGTQTLLISSRAEQCLKRFSMEGDYLGKIETPGAWVHGPVFAGEFFFSAVCWSHINEANADNSGFISIFNQNDEVVANLGAEAPQYKNGVLQPMTTTWDCFIHPHGVCVDKDGNVYVGQWRANNSYPFKLEKL